MKKENEKTNTQFTFRIYNANNILKFQKFQNEIKRNGESLSNAIEKIISDFLDNKEKTKLFKSLKTDMEYSFNKAFYSRLAPFSAHIIDHILNVRAENSLINKKLDILLNAITTNRTLTKEDLNNPTLEFLKESTYFEEMRKLLQLENKANLDKKNKKIERIKEREKIFNEYNYENITDFDEEYDLENNNGGDYENEEE